MTLAPLLTSRQESQSILGAARRGARRLAVRVGRRTDDYVTVYTLAAGRSCNDIHVSLKCAAGDGGGVYVTPPKLLLLTNQTKLSGARGS